MERQIGLLGAGFISAFHVRALSRVPGARIAWVCDADLRRAEALAATIPGARATASLDAMLAGKPHAVHVLLPPDAHATAALRCLAGGAHVFVEKPLATSSGDVRRIAAAAEAAGRRVGVNHNVVFNPTFRKLVDAVRARALGELQHLSLTWNVPLKQLQAGQHGHWMFRSPLNILLEQAVHPLSMVQFLLGDLVSASVAPAETQALSTGGTFHRRWMISLVLQRGTAQLLLSFGRDFKEVRVLAIGEDGSATVDLKRNTFVLRTHGFQEPPLDDLAAGLVEGGRMLRTAAGNFLSTILGFLRLGPAFDPFAESIAASVRSFHEAVAADREPPVGLAAGGAVIAMCEAAKSADESLREPLPGSPRLNLESVP